MSQHKIFVNLGLGNNTLLKAKCCLLLLCDVCVIVSCQIDRSSIIASTVMISHSYLTNIVARITF